MSHHHTLDDATWLAVTNFSDEVAAAYMDAKRDLAERVKQAHWRLNEMEHELQWKALGHFWQWFYYPYGSRRKASNKNVGDNDRAYFASLPAHHRGDPTRNVAFIY